MKKKKKIDILLPCYNEEKTLGECIKRIQIVMNQNNDYNYAIVVCDNNSTDQSRKIAKKNQAIVLKEEKKGYGSTLINGILKSKADYIVMLDSDLSYNEKDIPRFIKELERGADLVMGNRFLGNIEKKAMPFSHRYGSKFLTEYANILFHTPSHDYHCGLRAFKRIEILKCNLTSTGFEFASEMIIQAKCNNLKIVEISTDLFKDGRDTPPHLKTIKDGIKHLVLINKLKFQKSPIMRYTTTFILLITLMFFSLVITSIIPSKYIYNNTIKSLDYFDKRYHNQTHHDSSSLEGCGDVRNLSLAYSMNNKRPFDSAIRMSYQSSLDPLINLKETFIKSNKEVENYSRYWHGQAMYSKLMLLLMPLKYTYIIQLIILIVLFIILTKQLFFISKKLAVSFIIMTISINAFFTAFSVQYFFVTMLSFAFSIVLIKLQQKNSKYIGLMFAISGALTCFFDFLTSETLVLTLPLFIFIFLNINDNKKTLIKNTINYIFLWSLFFSLTFITKWFIVCLYFGFDYIYIIQEKAMIRVDSQAIPIYIKFFKIILLSFKDMLPFDYINYGMIYFLGIFLLGLYLLIFDYKKYLPLLLAVIIPFLRVILLSSHSHLFHYYTYRAFGPTILLLSLLFISKIYDITKRIKSVKK